MSYAIEKVNSVSGQRRLKDDNSLQVGSPDLDWERDVSRRLHLAGGKDTALIARAYEHVSAAGIRADREGSRLLASETAAPQPSWRLGITRQSAQTMIP